ncbi:MAG: N-acetyltransferase [Chloroflexota bacterium]|nr:MAG: N-acetyltransferase [Chloroflexota bacterium]
MVFREVTDETWGDFERLFESRGGPQSCWCMAWRAANEEARRTDGTSRKAMMKTRVQSGVPVGILGYACGVPVAWCSVAPRCTHRAGLADAQPGDVNENVWSLVCFFVTRTARGNGVLKRLIEAAKVHVKARGATVIEAYPVDEDSPSYRFGGFVSSFDEAGFVRIGRSGTRRHVVRLRLA